MSSQRGNCAKSGHQKYQNTKAFRNDLHQSSKTIKGLNALQLAGCCKRCKEVIEWKIKFNKYKILAMPKKCVSCLQKSVKNSYYTLCQKCIESKNICGKCGETLPFESTTETSETKNKQENIKAKGKSAAARKPKVESNEDESEEDSDESDFDHEDDTYESEEDKSKYNKLTSMTEEASITTTSKTLEAPNDLDEKQDGPKIKVVCEKHVVDNKDAGKVNASGKSKVTFKDQMMPEDDCENDKHESEDDNCNEDNEYRATSKDEHGDSNSGKEQESAKYEVKTEEENENELSNTEKEADEEESENESSIDSETDEEEYDNSGVN